MNGSDGAHFQVMFGRPSGIYRTESSPTQIHHLTHCFFTSTYINVYTHLLYLSANTDLTNEFNNTEKTN